MIDLYKNESNTAYRWFLRGKKMFNLNYDTITYTTLINSFSKFGEIEKVEFFIQCMIVKKMKISLFCLTCVIDCCNNCGEYGKGLSWFKRAGELGLGWGQLDIVVFVSLFLGMRDACVGSSGLEGGWELGV